MAWSLAAILASGDGRIFCVVLVVIAFVAVGLCRKSNRVCPRCQHINPPQARYCAHCGGRLNRP